jgi:uncharacterized protein (UPF0276 family)
MMPMTSARIGLAYGPGLVSFVERNPGMIDYVEIPFELLRHDPSIATIQSLAPVVLHCASLSIAGFVPPTEGTIDAIVREAERTKTPWIGEHLAFISADPLTPGAAMHEPTTLTYTVCPQLSEQVLDRACENLAECQSHFSVPLIVENSPQYFKVPGSSMSIIDFAGEFHRRSGAGMLLDLTHLMISSINMNFDPKAQLARLPLEYLVEMHVSGLDIQSGTAWDDHAGIADERIFELMEVVFERARPQAVTFEYNWSPVLPDKILAGQIERTRNMLDHA